jgi:phosphoserine phosphatase
VLDLDGTLIETSAGLALCDALANEGYVPPGLPALIRTRELPSAYEAYARAITGLSVGDVTAVASRAWAAIPLFAFVREAVSLLASHGFTVALASGSPVEMVRCAAAELGCVVACAGRFGVHQGRYTGKVVAAPSLPGEKERIFERLGPGPRHVIALGNTLGDAGVLARSCVPLTFEPSAELGLLAARHGWPVVDRHTVLPTLTDVASTRGREP